MSTPGEPMGPTPEPMPMEPMEPMEPMPMGAEPMGNASSLEDAYSDLLFGMLGRSVRVGESAVHGRGVFALRALRSGEIVDVCPTIEIEDSNLVGIARQHSFRAGRSGFLLLPAGPWMLLNYSHHANIGFTEGESFIVFTATRDIAKGDEITLSQG